MKVLHLTSTLGSAGAESMLVALAKHDSSNSHMVCTVYSDSSYKKYAAGIFKNKLEDARVAVISLNLASRLFIPIAFVRFFLLILKEKPDIIHSYLFLDNVMARIMGRLGGKKVLCSKRDSDRGKPLFVGILNRLTAWLADATVTNFRDGIEELKKDGIREDRIFYIPNGKDALDYQPSLSREEAREALGLGKDGLLLGFTGRLVWYKGQQYLIAALQQVIKKYPHTRLLLVGEGKNRETLEQMVPGPGLSENILFLGNRTDIPRVLRALDLFVSPSLRDGMPGAVMEAMAAGLPVIATDADGSKDLIRNYENGILVPVRNSNAIAEKIIELIENKTLAGRLGRNASETISKRFTVERMVSEYQRLYASLAGV